MVQNAKLIRKQKKINHIFNIIVNGKDLSKQEIKNLSGYSMSTVLNAIDNLKDKKLITEEQGAPCAFGRPPYAINANKSNGIIIGVEFSSSSVNVIALNLGREIIANNEQKLSSFPDKDEVISAIIQLTKKTINESKSISNNLLGIGIGAPGNIDRKRQTVSNYSYIKNWFNINLKSLLEREFNLPVYLENNVNSIALGLKWVDYDGEMDNMVLLAIRSGVKIAIVNNNELIKGKNGLAGEIGKLSTTINNYPISFEKALSLVEIERQIVEAKDEFQFKGIDLEEELSIVEKINKGYQKKDKDCITLYNRLIDIIASLVYTIDLILNPKKIVIASEYCILDAFDFYLQNKIKQKYELNLDFESMIYSNPLGAVGACSIVLENLYKF